MWGPAEPANTSNLQLLTTLLSLEVFHFLLKNQINKWIGQGQMSRYLCLLTYSIFISQQLEKQSVITWDIAEQIVLWIWFSSHLFSSQNVESRTILIIYCKNFSSSRNLRYKGSCQINNCEVVIWGQVLPHFRSFIIYFRYHNSKNTKWLAIKSHKREIKS